MYVYGGPPPDTFTVSSSAWPCVAGELEDVALEIASGAMAMVLAVEVVEDDVELAELDAGFAVVVVVEAEEAVVAGAVVVVVVPAPTDIATKAEKATIIITANSPCLCMFILCTKNY